MSSILKVDEIQDTSGNNIINENANTVTIGKSGDTVNVVGTLQNNGNNAVGITMADNWRLSAAYTSGTGQNDITSNWERNDTSGTGFIGTGMTESSGIFSFPQTGIYLIHAGTYMVGQNANYAGLIIKTTTDNSTYSEQTLGYNEVGSATNEHSGVLISYIFDVTDISTHKVKLTSETAAAVTISGNTSADRTYLRFIRLGDT